MIVLAPWFVGIVVVFIVVAVVAGVARWRDDRRAARLAEEERISAPLAGPRAALTAPPLRQAWPVRQVSGDLALADRLAERAAYQPRHGSNEIARTPLSYEPWHLRGRPISGEFAAIVARNWAEQVVSAA